jgi:hypothetical protein
MNKLRNHKPNNQKFNNHKFNNEKFDTHFLIVNESDDPRLARKTIDDFYNRVKDDHEAKIKVFVCDSMMPYFKNVFKDYNGVNAYECNN